MMGQDPIIQCINGYAVSYVDNFSELGEDGVKKATGLTQEQYNNLYEKMLKSIYENGGFYIGRYETGIENSFRKNRTDSIEENIPVIKVNAYPYNFVTCSQAQTVVTTNFKQKVGKYTTSLMFGVQWDLVLKYLESKVSNKDDFNSNNTTWGIYYNNTSYTTKAESKGSTKDGLNWDLSGGYSKSGTEKKVLLTTGASDEFNKQNIYDIAGNVWEWTLEYTADTNNPCSSRGGSYYDHGIDSANYRGYSSSSGCNNNVGFRSSIF